MKNKMLSLVCIFIFLMTFLYAGNVAAALPGSPALEPGTPETPEAPSLPSSPALEPGVPETPETPSLPGGLALEPGIPEAPEAPDAGSEYLAIPAAAFLPEGESQNYENHGRYIKVIHSTGFESTSFNAAVHLPHGARITQVGLCFYDTVTANATARLYRRDGHNGINTSLIEMASAITSGSNGYLQIATTSIVDPVVDNANYIYWINLYIPDPPAGENSVWGCGATIRYDRPASSTGIFSIPSGTFKPTVPQDNYEVTDGYIRHYYGAGFYTAQIDLPDGATMQKLKIRTVDKNSSNEIDIYLYRANAQGVIQQLATIRSPDSADAIETSTTTINSPVIDNTNYVYYLMLILPPWGDLTIRTDFYSAVIEYTGPANPSYPTVSLSNSAFTPFYDHLEYANSGAHLFHLHSEGGGSADGVYLAPVYLPHRSQVSTVLFKYYDGTNTQNASAYLVRTRLGVNDEMVTFTSSGYGGYGSSTKSATYETIDNRLYAYFAYYVLPVAGAANPGTNVAPVFLAINYTSPPQSVYLPLIKK